ncbi:D-alanyl-D-alanine carboxypeptidase/D-alanyl-D-alanine-endopeptidase [Terriglobus sp.]|uniref:D-alanyl-D-alanine carboxypeptidase/D-alanyl-D-alanine endopeptidase n=1 Tax=Terriglobus sp. TaxID=1889013 RepID=UPI003AFFDEAA
MLRTAAALLCLTTLTAASMGQTAAPLANQHPATPANTTLQQQIEAITHEPAVARAHWGISVTTLSGAPIASLNDGQFFQPASNTKLFTSAAAMALLPMQERLRTDVIATGYFRPNGVFEGDLTLRGVGDANLSGRPVPYQPRIAGQIEPPRDELRYIDELADKVKAAGITQITGDIIGDDSLFPWDPYPADWEIDDTPWYYGAPINALMIADNAVTLTVTPSSHPASNSASPAQSAFAPALPYYNVDMQATTGAKGSETHLDIQRTIGERTVHVYGTIAADAKPYVQDMSIADPAEYAALALQAALTSRGITVLGQAHAKHLTGYYEPSFTKTSMQPVEPLAPSGTRSIVLKLNRASCQDCGAGCDSRIIAEHTSTPWVDDIAVTNKTSQNQHAELLLRQLGFAYGVGGTTVGGARVVRTFLTSKAVIDPQDFVFYDGSGLSGHDIVTPRAITQLLRYATTQPWGAQWKASLPIGGVDGSLRSRFPDTPLKGHIFAKTGTLGEARALSGYLDCASGQTVVFSIMVSTHTPLNNEDQKAMDRIVAAVAAAE